MPRLLADLEGRPRALRRPGQPRDHRRRRLGRRHRRSCVEALRRPAAGRARPARARTRARAPRSAPASRRRSRRCRRRGFVVTLEADTTSDLDALPPMLAEAPRRRRPRARLGPRRRPMVERQPHRGGSQRAAPATSSAARSGSTRAPSRPSSASTAPRVLRARATTSYGDDLIRERGFACKAELLAKLARARARGSRRCRSTSTATAAVGESKMPVFPTVAGYWRLHRPPAARAREVVSCRVSRPSVGIVGGGILGLTAAYRLAAGRRRGSRSSSARKRPRRPRRRVRPRRAPRRPLLPRGPADRRPRHRPRRGARPRRPLPLPARPASASTTTAGSSR